MIDMADVGLAAHEARTTLKRARALSRFVRPALTSDAYDSADRTLRSAGRCAAPIRDADVLVETAGAVRAATTEPGLDEAWGSLIGELEANRDGLFATATGPDGPCAKARDLLGALTVCWPAVVEMGDLEWLRVVMTTSYDAARAHHQRACGEGSDAEAQHELRKRAKDLRHQLEFLAPIAVEVLEPYSIELHHLSDLLGESNDLTVLGRSIEAAGGITDSRTDALLSDVDERRQALSEEARRLAAGLLERETEAFVGWVEDCWVKARGQG